MCAASLTGACHRKSAGRSGRGIAFTHKGRSAQANPQQSTGPLVLVFGGTGWAPIWSLALAAREHQRDRKMIVIAGAPDPQSLYMRPALDWLLDDGVEDVIATSEVNAQWPTYAASRPIICRLSGKFEDTVYVAGPVGLVDAVKRKAGISVARCYADPFLPKQSGGIGYRSRAGPVPERESASGCRRSAQQPSAERLNQCRRTEVRTKRRRTSEPRH